MFRKLFNGRRKVVTLVAVVAVLASLSIGLWAQLAPKTVPVRVIELDAEVSSIKLPIKGEWKDTGPITVSLASKATQFPLGQLNVRQEEAVIVWPVSISAPLLKELGFEKIEAMMVGLGTRKEGSLVSSDITVLRIPGLPNLVVAQTWSCVACSQLPARSAFWEGQPGGEIRGAFKMDEEIWRKVEQEVEDKYGDLLRFVKRSISIAAQFMHLPIENVDDFVANMYKLNKQTMHELLIYIPEFESYQTADLKGSTALRIER